MLWPFFPIFSAQSVYPCRKNWEKKNESRLQLSTRLQIVFCHVIDELLVICWRRRRHTASHEGYHKIMPSIILAVLSSPVSSASFRLILLIRLRQLACLSPSVRLPVRLYVSLHVRHYLYAYLHPSVCQYVCMQVSKYVNLFLCLSVCLSATLPTCLSVHLPVCFYVCPQITNLSVSMFVCLPGCLSVSLSVCLYVCVPVCSSFYLFVFLSAGLSILLSFSDCVFTCLSISLPTCLHHFSFV